MVKRKIVDSSPEDLSNLQRLVGPESILAHCAGVNYQVYVTESRLLVGKRFRVGEDFMNVPTSNINTLELITKSLVPPLTFAVLGAIGSFLIWWFPMAQRLPLPVFPYDLGLLAGLAIMVLSLVVAWWRVGIAVLRIRLNGSKNPITVKLVSTAKAEEVFKALKG
ncbi:MAG TPA: hypothetical protein VFE96_02650 [Candidatus Bathyarchaeia archaeon]|nr:hypothetical protein [Candidatus Bathyarchaeia archaeon]